MSDPAQIASLSAEVARMQSVLSQLTGLDASGTRREEAPREDHHRSSYRDDDRNGHDRYNSRSRSRSRSGDRRRERHGRSRERVYESSRRAPSPDRPRAPSPDRARETSSYRDETDDTASSSRYSHPGVSAATSTQAYAPRPAIEDPRGIFIYCIQPSVSIPQFMVEIENYARDRIVRLEVKKPRPQVNTLACVIELSTDEGCRRVMSTENKDALQQKYNIRMRQNQRRFL